MAGSMEELLTEFCQKEGLTGAFSATRSGNFIAGIVPKGQHRDTFVAMTAIVHGGAETISLEMKVPLGQVRIDLSDHEMVILAMGSNAILSVVGTGIDTDLIGKARALAKDLEGHIH